MDVRLWYYMQSVVCEYKYEQDYSVYFCYLKK